MKEEIKRIRLLYSAALRDDIWNESFHCLDSFLHALVSRSGADEAGIFRILVNGELAPESKKRVFSPRTSKSNTTTDETLEEVCKLLTKHGADPEHRFRRVISFLDIPSLKNSDCGGWFTLRRFFPDSRWRRRGEEEHDFWFFVVNPRLWMVGGNYEEGDIETLQHIGNLSASFMRWKTERLEMARRSISEIGKHKGVSLSDVRTRVVRQFFWPIRPEVMLSNLEAIHNWTTPERINRIQAISELRRESKGCGGRCNGSAVLENKTSPCGWKPRKLSADQTRIDILPGLYLWKLRFWEVPEVEKDDRNYAISSIKKAAEFLVGSWKEEAIFGSGGGRNLLSWFTGTAILELLDDAEHGRAIREFRIGDHALHLIEKLSSLAAVLIGEGRWKPNAIELLPYVIGIYGHVVLEIPDQLELVRHLQQTLRGEAALHTLKTRYRDHFFHTIEVCLIGFALLKSKRHGRQFAEEIIDWCKKGHGKVKAFGKRHDYVPKSAPDLMSQWWVASLIHDTAYSIDALNSTVDLLSFFSDDESTRVFCGKVRQAIREMSSSQVQLNEEILPEMLEDNTISKGDHGLIAATHIKATLANRGTGIAGEFAPAIRASAFHNSKFPQIDAGSDPVAALLVLCDTIQDWGRSQHGFSKRPEAILSRIIDEATTPTAEQFGNVNSFSFSLKLDNQKRGLTWQDKNSLTIKLDFRPLISRNLGIIYKWADICSGLQRVDFSRWSDIDISLVYITPFLNQGLDREEPTSSFEILCAYDRNTSHRFFSRFIMCAARKELMAINWCAIEKDGTRWDQISFNLKALGKDFRDGFPAFAGSLGEFSRSLTNWKEYGRTIEICNE